MIDQLIVVGRIVPDSRVDLVKSGVAVAVRAGAAHPEIVAHVALECIAIATPRAAP